MMMMIIIIIIITTTIIITHYVGCIFRSSLIIFNITLT